MCGGVYDVQQMRVFLHTPFHVEYSIQHVPYTTMINQCHTPTQYTPTPYTQLWLGNQIPHPTLP